MHGFNSENLNTQCTGHWLLVTNVLRGYSEIKEPDFGNDLLHWESLLICFLRLFKPAKTIYVMVAPSLLY